MSLEDAKKALRNIADPEIARHSLQYFKTGKGGYGEGDRFLGIRVPQIRKVAKRFSELSLDETTGLLQSQYHEERLCALIILVNKMKKATPPVRERIFQLYLDHIAYVNNWDLVDSSAEHIVGAYLEDKDRDILYRMAISDDLWERRIAIMSTFHFIRDNDFNDTLKISEELLQDDHDLIHKAVGWMLREVGNRNIEIEEDFLDKYGKQMPRTMLRYAIEKFPEEKRQHYLKL